MENNNLNDKMEFLESANTCICMEILCMLLVNIT
jgi:hypothetical protein